ncbi:hypothetical protein SLEP1_g46697 [Rubroshorea leprosula]|uniref:Uncharacterized protein n=1 Tax=Rubroshorea leprosula TaxID=152421 RepID=A0AAV5LQS3_9ROSI|nr:hypothetical protein SLEP1_g46697 [Rubroshorea leprosula]
MRNPRPGFMKPKSGFLTEPKSWVPHGTPLLGSRNPVAGFAKPARSLDSSNSRIFVQFLFVFL